MILGSMKVMLLSMCIFMLDLSAYCHINTKREVINNQNIIIDQQDEIIRRLDILNQQNAEVLKKQDEIKENQKVAERQREEAAAAQKEQNRQNAIRQTALIMGTAVPTASEKIMSVAGRTIKLENNAGTFRIPGNLKNIAASWKKGDIVDIYDNSTNDTYCTVLLKNSTRGNSTKVTEVK